MDSTYDHLVEVMLTGDDDFIDEVVLLESEKDEILHALDGETTLMNYMMLFEEFLDDHDLYLFKGWENAQFVGRPKVEKFWVTFYLMVGSKTDLRGAKRIKTALSQGEVKAKKLEDGNILVKFMILKRDLDTIENRNKEKIEELSDRAMEKI